MELKFRDLLADEIECRVGSTNENGFQLLLYKNARIDMALLDEVVGVGNWQREHIILGNDIYCRLGIWNKELNQWVWKTDAGSSGTIEEEKSKASDSFKRAATNFGLGRCLYSAPFIWIVVKDKQGNLTGESKKEHYSVKVIGYKDHKITQLVIINDKTKQVVYSYGYKENVAQNGDLTPKTTENKPNSQPQEPKGSIDNHDLDIILSYLNMYKEESKNKFYALIERNYGTDNVRELTYTQGQKVRAWLEGDR